MKTRIIALIVVFSVVLIWMPQKFVECELVIAAPPDVVWAALTDTDGFAAWSPMLVNMTGVM